MVRIDYLEQGKTITGDYYPLLLKRLQDRFRPNIDIWPKLKLLFHQETAHKFAFVVRIHDFRFKVHPNASYLPNLDHSYCFLFINVRKWFAVRKFKSSIFFIRARTFRTINVHPHACRYNI